MGVGRHTQTPLAHLLLNNGITATFRYTVYYFVVGQHGTQLRTPVHHGLAQVGDAVIHQRFLLLFFTHSLPFVGRKAQFFAAGCVQSFGTFSLERLYQSTDGLRFLQCIVVVALEHLLESPLCPVVVFGIASTYLAVPVERETYLVQLFAIAVDVGGSSDGRVLSGLYGILFSRESVSVISHGIQYVETLQAFVAGVDVRSNVT